MFGRVIVLFLFAHFLAPAVIIDRVAIVVGTSIIKQSDIDRNIRATDFLNGTPLSEGTAVRKVTAKRLIDQVFIRKEIRSGEYPVATLEQADKQLDGLRKQKFRSDAAFESALRRYGLTELELRTQFQWQLTVLQFIDARFKSAAFATDAEIEKYYRENTAALRRQFPSKSSVQELEPEIQNIVAGENVNKLFFSWLEEQRKDTKIRYLEESLR